MALRAYKWLLLRPLLVFWLDCACIPIAYAFAVKMTLPGRFGPTLLANAHYGLIMMATWLNAASDQDLWSSRRSGMFGAFLAAVVRAAGQALVITVFVMVFVTPQWVNTYFLTAFFIGTILLMATVRGATHVVYRLRRSRGQDLRHVLFIGASDRTRQFAAEVRRQPGYVAEGFLDDDAERAREFDTPNLKYLGTCRDFDRILDERHIDEVYISLTLASFYTTIEQIVQRCEQRGLDAHVKADFFQLQHARNLPMYVGDIPILSLTTVPENQVDLALKRALDFVVSSILLVVLAPAFCAIAIVIKIQSPGPVFFLQERVGQNQRRFKMFKFRSMVANAEELRKDLENKNEADGPVFKIRQDPRITPFGRFIRKYSIDELPQLINVWRGEMSLVGPRPPIASEVEQYAWEQRRRLSVKPGMTGLWQVSGRSDIGFRQWVEMDLAYIDSWSFWLDIVILFRTFRVVLEGKGAA